jgi:branched-chain amino acid transport system ATP-binding protein
MDLVVGVSDRIAVIHHGQLLRCDTPEAVMDDAKVRDAYLGSDW